MDADGLARRTTCFTWQNLKDMVNEAAVRAAIAGAESVTMKYFELARDQFVQGKKEQLLYNFFDSWRHSSVHFIHC